MYSDHTHTLGITPLQHLIGHICATFGVTHVPIWTRGFVLASEGGRQDLDGVVVRTPQLGHRVLAYDVSETATCWEMNGELEQGGRSRAV